MVAIPAAQPRVANSRVRRTFNNELPSLARLAAEAEAGLQEVGSWTGGALGRSMMRPESHQSSEHSQGVTRVPTTFIGGL